MYSIWLLCPEVIGGEEFSVMLPDGEFTEQTRVFVPATFGFGITPEILDVAIYNKDKINYV